MTNTNEIKVGTKVIYSGFEGTVTRVCEWDTRMIEVRLNRGEICTSKSEFDGTRENCRIVEL